MNMNKLQSGSASSAQLRRSGAPAKNLNNPQHAQRTYERYLTLAQAEVLAGDQVAAENYYQHAEHYLRSMSR